MHILSQHQNGCIYIKKFIFIKLALRYFQVQIVNKFKQLFYQGKNSSYFFLKLTSLFLNCAYFCIVYMYVSRGFRGRVAFISFYFSCLVWKLILDVLWITYIKDSFTLTRQIWIIFIFTLEVIRYVLLNMLLSRFKIN